MTDYLGEAREESDTRTRHKIGIGTTRIHASRKTTEAQPQRLVRVSTEVARALIHPNFSLPPGQLLALAEYILGLRQCAITTSALYTAKGLAPSADCGCESVSTKPAGLTTQRNAIMWSTLQLIALLEPGFGDQNQLTNHSISWVLSKQSNLNTEYDRRGTRTNIHSVTHRMQRIEQDPSKKLRNELIYQLVIMYINLIEFQCQFIGDQYNRTILTSCLPDKISVGTDELNLGQYLNIMVRVFERHFTKPANPK